MELINLDENIVSQLLTQNINNCKQILDFCNTNMKYRNYCTNNNQLLDFIIDNIKLKFTILQTIMKQYIEYWDEIDYLHGQQAEWAYKDYQIAQKVLPNIVESLRMIEDNASISFNIVNKLCHKLYNVCSKIVMDNETRMDSIYSFNNTDEVIIDSDHIEKIENYIDNLGKSDSDDYDSDDYDSDETIIS